MYGPDLSPAVCTSAFLKPSELRDIKSQIPLHSAHSFLHHLKSENVKSEIDFQPQLNSTARDHLHYLRGAEMR